ncbi:signal peptide peptidase SppA [Candidatus Woesearchaeota archaeon]|nr:signal peptide peptidase SppA [Candidatus Woesearchaeota archaeon]
MAKKKQRSMMKVVLIVLGCLFVLSWVLALALSGWGGSSPVFGNVALIRIVGTISSSGDGSLFGGGGVDSMTVVGFIEAANEDPTIDAILFEINSPGGNAVASEEIVRAVKASELPTVSWIRESGASGAYWVASATDYVVASPMSVTGSVGVLSSYLEYARLLEDYNVTYRKFTGGVYKDIMNPMRVIGEDEAALVQQKVDLIHGIFLRDVAQNRNLSSEQVEEIGTGIFFLGVEAVDNGLVDELGGKEEAIALLEEVLESDVGLVSFEPERGFLESLTGLVNGVGFWMGRGFGSSFLQARHGFEL